MSIVDSRKEVYPTNAISAAEDDYTDAFRYTSVPLVRCSGPPPNVPLNLIGLHAASAICVVFLLFYRLRSRDIFDLFTFPLLLFEREPDLYECERFELFDPTVPRGPVLVNPRYPTTLRLERVTILSLRVLRP